MDDKKTAAADPRVVTIDDTEGQTGGDGRINGVSTFSKACMPAAVASGCTVAMACFG